MNEQSPLVTAVIGDRMNNRRVLVFKPRIQITSITVKSSAPSVR